MSIAETAEEAPPAPTRRRSPATVVAAVLAVVFFVSTVLLAVVAADLKSDQDEGDGTRTDVADAAGRFVEAVTSYDYADPDTSREAVLSLSTAPFSEQYEAALPAIQESLAATQSVSAGNAREVFLSDVGDDGTATAVVEYDRVLDGASGERTESNRYLRLGLVELDGAWRVNDVIDLNVVFANAPNGPASPGTTTTTTG